MSRTTLTRDARPRSSRGQSRFAARPRGSPIFAVLVAGMLFVASVCLVIAITAIDQPMAGFLFYPFRNVGSVAGLEWEGLKAGARYQDIIEEVNGRSVSTSREVQRIVADTPVGTYTRYVLNRQGQPFVIDVPVSVFTRKDFVKLFGPLFLAGVLFGIVGVVVYVLKPDTGASWAFSLFCFSLGSYMIGGLPIQLPPHSVWLYTLNVLAQPVYPAALLHLSLVFPERTRLVEKRPWVQGLPYVASVGLGLYLLRSIVAMAGDTGDAQAFLSAHSHLLRGINVSRFYAILAATSMALACCYVYWRSHSMIARQRSRVILFGSAVAFLPPTLVMPFVLLAKIGIPFNLIVLPAFAFPASVGYAIARHNLFDVDVYLKRALGYVFMTAVVGVGYLLAQTALTTVVLDPIFGGQAATISPIVFAVLIVFFFNPINRKVQASVDRIFFRKKLDYMETISTVSNALTSMLNLDQIFTQVVQTIRTQMFVESAGVVIFEPKAHACRSFFVGDRKDHSGPRDDIRVAYEDPLLALLREEKTLITRYDLEEDPRYEAVKTACLEQLAVMSASLAIPLKYHGDVTGMLAVGDKKSGGFYGREDIDLLTTMANQAAVAMQNATAHEQVVRYAEELAASLRRIQVLESIKTNLAKFVPKTVQQLIEESPEAPSLEKRETDVSVVFADITGYTRLSAQMELDQVNRLVERYFGAFLDEIVKCGGDVNETVGDGLMVIFRDGDPQRHARAAVLAALGIQRRTEEINGELRGQSEPIEMHVGVNSGIASVGATKIEGAAGTRWTYTASGPTTNVAARLAALGEAGAVILSAETRRRLGDGFEADDLGLQTLKNVAQPVRVYRIKGGSFVERRRFPRHPVTWSVRLCLGEEVFEGRGLDGAPYGLCVTNVPIGRLEPGLSCILEISRGDSVSRHVATVRYVADRGIGLETKDALRVP